MRKIFLLVLMILFSMASVSYAQIDEGTTEVGGLVLLTLSDSTTTYMLRPNVGYFLNPEIELGLAVTAMRSETDGNNSSNLMLDGQVKYHFYKIGQIVVPYAGGQVGIYTSSNGKTNTTFSFGGMGGAKFFLKEDVSLNLETNYMYRTGSGGGGSLQLLAGISYYFVL